MFNHSKYFNNKKGNNSLLHSTRSLLSQNVVSRNLVLSNRKNNKTSITSSDLINAFEKLTSNDTELISNVINADIVDNLDIVNGGTITNIQTDTITSSSGDTVTFKDTNVVLEKDLTVEGNITVNGTIGNFSVEDFKINDNLIYLNMAGTNNTILTGTQMLNPDNMDSNDNQKYIGMIYFTGGTINSTSYKFTNSSDITGSIKLCYNGFDPTTTDSSTLTQENFNYLSNLSYVNLDINNLSLYGESITQSNSNNNINFKIVSDIFFQIDSSNDTLVSYKNFIFDTLADSGTQWAFEFNAEHSLSVNGIYNNQKFSILSFNPDSNKSGNVTIFRNLEIDMLESNNTTDSVLEINGRDTNVPLVELKNSSLGSKKIRNITYFKESLGTNSITSEEIEDSSGSFNILVAVRGESGSGNIHTGYHVVGTFIFEGTLKLYPIVHLLNDNNVFDLDVVSNNNKITLTLANNNFSGNIYWTAEIKILSIK